MRLNSPVVSAAVSFAVTALPLCVAAAPAAGDVRAAAGDAVRPLMNTYGIPGMAVGISIDGRRYVLDYGVASKATGKRVDATTLFEVGSISKTFTATLAAYAAQTGKLALSDTVSSDLPVLRGTSFDRIPLVDLATYTAGGLPLQLPDAVRSDDDAVRYYQRWKPSHAPGTYRLYSNPSIMLLGLTTATRLGDRFAPLVQRIILDPLGMRDTFISIPDGARSRYAQGYTDDGTPRRMAPGPLADEAYGIRTTAGDLLRFIDANMDLVTLPGTLRRALHATRTTYLHAGPITQDLVWEQYPYPLSLAALQRGNAADAVGLPVRAIDPPAPAARSVWVNKTGSTNGFAAYAAFVPARKIGIVLLANRAYPISARIAAAYAIVHRLERA